MNGPMLCFGDSNTYGYDPRSYLGSRYPTEERWTGILKGRGWEILNCGENGREIPHRASELEALDRLLERSGRLEGIVLMLGGNDLLQNPAFAAEDVAARMEEMLGRLLEHSAVRENGAGVLLLGSAAHAPRDLGDGGESADAVRPAGRLLWSIGPAAGYRVCRYGALEC